MKERKASWRFAPNMGGAEQGNNPGQQHFAAGALTAMVRETLQNSLDHHEDGLEPVEVSYQVIQVGAEEVYAAGLTEHVQACLEEAAGESETEERYTRMRESLRQDPIPCLAVIDQNTTGLRGNNWDNLILKEESPAAGEDRSREAPSGSAKTPPSTLPEPARSSTAPGTWIG